jgi:hypothetical protein
MGACGCMYLRETLSDTVFFERLHRETKEHRPTRKIDSASRTVFSSDTPRLSRVIQQRLTVTFNLIRLENQSQILEGGRALSGDAFELIVANHVGG